MAANAGFDAPEIAEVVDAHARQIASLHVNDPQAALDSLSKLKIARSGSRVAKTATEMGINKDAYRVQAKAVLSDLRARAAKMAEAGKEIRDNERIQREYDSVLSQAESIKNPEELQALLEGFNSLEALPDNVMNEVEATLNEAALVLDGLTFEQKGDIKQVAESIKGDGVKISLMEKNGIITVDKIIVPENKRGEGLGSSSMAKIIDYANSTGQTIALTPSVDFGGTKTRLKSFYKGLGFVANKGKKKVFETSEAMIKEPVSGVYEQDIKGNYATINKLITLFEKAGPETIAHELQHNYTEELLTVAEGSNIKDAQAAQELMNTAGEWMAGAGRDRALEIRNGTKTILSDEDFVDSLKMGGTDEAGRLVFHEMMSEGYEQYLLEGKSPSKKMSRVFDAFRAWLADVYTDVKQLVADKKIPALDDKIRELFEKSVSFDADILRGSRAVVIPENSSEAMRINAGDLKKFSTIMDKSMAAITDRRNDYLNDVRKKMKPAIKKVAQSTWDLQDFSKIVKSVNAHGAIDPESFVDVYGREALATITAQEPELFVADGRDISAVQEKVKLDDLSGLIKGYKSYDSILQEVTKEEMDKLQTEAVTVAAFTSDEAIEYQGKITAMMSKKTKPVSQGEIKALARAFVREGKTVGEATASLYLAESARKLSADRSFLLGKAKEKALSEEDFTSLVQINEQMYLAMEMAKEAERIRKSTDKKIRQVGRDAGKNNEVQAREIYNIGGQKFVADRSGRKMKDDHYSMYALLADALGIKKLTVKGKKKAVQVVNEKSLAEFVDMESLTDKAKALAESGLDIARQQSGKSRKYKGEDRIFQGYKNLTMDQFDQWNEVLNSVAFSGKHLSSPRATVAGEETTVTKAEFEILKHVRNRKLKEIDANKMGAKIREGTRNALNFTTSLEYLLKQYSGDSTKQINRGAARYIFEAINESEVNKAVMVDEKLTALADWQDAVTRKKIELFEKHGKTVGDLGSTTKQKMNTKSFTIDELAMIPAHIGTVEGWDKLRDGYGWTDAQLQSILDENFDAEYIQHFADMGAVLETLYAPSTEMLYKLRGQKIGKKENRVFAFKGRQFAGWYAPSTVDYQGSKEAKMIKYDEAEAEKINGASYMANVLRTNVKVTSFTKLSDAKYPLALSAVPILKHIDNMGTFIHMQETLDYVRVLIEPGTEFHDSFKDTMGSHNSQLLEDLVTGITVEATQPPGFGEDVFNFLVAKYREAIFAGKLSVRLTQVLGMFTAVRSMGPSGALHAIKSVPKVLKAAKTENVQVLMRQPRAVLDQIDIYNKSGMMKQRRDFMTHNMFNKVSEMDVGRAKVWSTSLLKAMKSDKTGFTIGDMSNAIAYAGITAFDQLVAHTTWWGRYESLKHQMLKDGSTEAKAESEAILQADAMVRQTQDLNRNIDVVLGQKSKGLQKTLFMFSSFAIRVHAQRVRLQYSHLKDDPKELARWIDTAMFIAWEALAPAIFGGVMRAMLRGDSPDDDEFMTNVFTDAVRDMIGGTVPVFGGMLVSPQYGAFGPVRNILRDWDTVQNSSNEERVMWAALRLLNTVSGAPQVVPAGLNTYKQIENFKELAK